MGALWIWCAELQWAVHWTTIPKPWTGLNFWVLKTVPLSNILSHTIYMFSGGFLPQKTTFVWMSFCTSSRETQTPQTKSILKQKPPTLAERPPSTPPPPTPQKVEHLHAFVQYSELRISLPQRKCTVNDSRISHASFCSSELRLRLSWRILCVAEWKPAKLGQQTTSASDGCFCSAGAYPGSSNNRLSFDPQEKHVILLSLSNRFRQNYTMGRTIAWWDAARATIAEKEIDFSFNWDKTGSLS